MGFWDTAGKIAKGVVSTMEEKAGEWKALEMRLEDKSNEELMKIAKSEGFFGSSQMEKAMAMKILKKRGEIS